MRVPRIRASPKHGGAGDFSVVPSVTDPQREVNRCISEESLMTLFSCSFVTQQGLTGEELIRVLRLCKVGAAAFIIIREKVSTSLSYFEWFNFYGTTVDGLPR